MIVEKIIATIERHALISKNDHIVLGLSGGPDSVCLFHVLTRLSAKLQLTIHPVHLNHKFRPGAAERDQRYVEALCARFGLPCHIFEKDCNALAAQTGMTSEEAGRAARYEAFHQVASQVAETIPSHRIKIAVAQNANDQAETILFRLLRGTGVDGLAGIAYQRQEKQFAVIRPLLDIHRDEIEAYCQAQGLHPVTDHTNMEAIYARNRIRLELIPYLEESYNGNIRESLVRLGRIAAADKDYLWREAERAYNQLAACSAGENGKTGTELQDDLRTENGADRSEIVMDRQALCALHPAIRHRVMMKAFEAIGLRQDISEERLQAADRIIGKKQAPKTVQFPYGYAVTVAKGRVYFTAP